MSKLAILLATYNSEKYLTEQIDSLLRQTCQNFDLYIRDDGSTDKTIELIRSYTTSHHNIHLVEDSVKARGAMGSFTFLMESVSADYYMFCDHDDVWLNNKIELSLCKILELEREYCAKPIVVHTDLCVVDKSLNTIDSSFWRSSKIKPDILQNFNYICVANCATGCTMIFNDRAKCLSLPISINAPMHDWWVAAISARDGVVGCVEEATILYRQHQANVVGARDVDGFYFVRKMINLWSTLKGQRELFPFLHDVGYGNLVKYYFYKILYTVKRQF